MGVHFVLVLFSTFHVALASLPSNKPAYQDPLLFSVMNNSCSVEKSPTGTPDRLTFSI